MKKVTLSTEPNTDVKYPNCYPLIGKEKAHRIMSDRPISVPKWPGYPALTVILRGMVFSAFGRESRSTPSFNRASIRF